MATSPLRNDRITGHDVARRAGVSQSTVSRALRDPTTVSAALRARVLDAAESLGYTPSELGRSLVTRRTRSVGMVVTDLENPFYPFLIGPLHGELSRLGYRMLLLSDDDPSRVSDQLIDRSVDGVVLTTTTLDSALPAHLEQHGVPFVLLARDSATVAADAVVVDNALGASILAAEVLRTGHRNVGAILGPSDTSTGAERRRGLSVTLASAGISLGDAPIAEGPFVEATGREAMREIMAADEPPSVVFCGNDTIAIGALNAAAALGLTVPDDVSIVGFDDLPLAGWEVIQLTTVRQPMREMAREAARMIIRRVEGEAAPDRVQRAVFEPELVVRHTLGPPRGGHASR